MIYIKNTFAEFFIAVLLADNDIELNSLYWRLCAHCNYSPANHLEMRTIQVFLLVVKNLIKRFRWLYVLIFGTNLDNFIIVELYSVLW